MKYSNDLTIGKGLEAFTDAKELYLVVRLDGNLHNPWKHEIIKLTPKDVEFRSDRLGSDMMLRVNLGLNIKDKVLFNDLHEAQVFRTQQGFEALQRATRELQIESRDWNKENKEFMGEVSINTFMDDEIFKRNATSKRQGE